VRGAHPTSEQQKPKNYLEIPNKINLVGRKGKLKKTKKHLDIPAYGYGKQNIGWFLLLFS